MYGAGAIQIGGEAARFDLVQADESGSRAGIFDGQVITVARGVLRRRGDRLGVAKPVP